MSLTTTERAICAKIAVEITEHPERWTQGTDARDAAGANVGALSPRAVCWCAVGFLCRETNYGENVPKIRDAFSDITRDGVTVFNDRIGRTASDVAAVFAKLAQEPQS